MEHLWFFTLRKSTKENACRRVIVKYPTHESNKMDAIPCLQVFQLVKWTHSWIPCLSFLWKSVFIVSVVSWPPQRPKNIQTAWSHQDWFSSLSDFPPFSSNCLFLFLFPFPSSYLSLSLPLPRINIEALLNWSSENVFFRGQGRGRKIIK